MMIKSVATVKLALYSNIHIYYYSNWYPLLLICLQRFQKGKKCYRKIKSKRKKPKK